MCMLCSVIPSALSTPGSNNKMTNNKRKKYRNEINCRQTQHDTKQLLGGERHVDARKPCAPCKNRKQHRPRQCHTTHGMYFVTHKLSYCGARCDSTHICVFFSDSMHSIHSQVFGLSHSRRSIAFFDRNVLYLFLSHFVYIKRRGLFPMIFLKICRKIAAHSGASSESYTTNVQIVYFICPYASFRCAHTQMRTRPTEYVRYCASMFQLAHDCTTRSFTYGPLIRKQYEKYSKSIYIYSKFGVHSRNTTWTENSRYSLINYWWDNCDWFQATVVCRTLCRLRSRDGNFFFIRTVLYNRYRSHTEEKELLKVLFEKNNYSMEWIHIFPNPGTFQTRIVGNPMIRVQ